MRHGKKSVLSFYRSGELFRQGGARVGAVVTAGRCSSTTTTSCATCIEVTIPVDV